MIGKKCWIDWKKQIVAVLICLVAVLGIAGREPIQAAFERLFYYLPGAGMYVDEEGNTLYEAEIINGEFTENDIHVRLKNVYAGNDGGFIATDTRGV